MLHYTTNKQAKTVLWYSHIPYSETFLESLKADPKPFKKKAARNAEKRRKER